ncbi:MAG: glycosyltransferase family 39 protein [Chloroflexota bacterium]
MSRITVLVALLVFLGSGAVFYDRAARVGYNTDEGQAIWPSQYFQFVFLEGQVSGPVWQENYWTLTQVPVYRYIIGAGIWLTGNSFLPLDLDFRRDEVSGPDRAKYFDPATYRDERKLAEQRRTPRPSAEALWGARLPMVVLGAGTAAMLFVLTAELAGGLFGPALGALAGVVAAITFVAAPFVLTLLPRAHTEAPFLFFLVLALWLSVRAAARRSLTFGALAGLAAGLSAGSKLTGVLALAALGGFAAGAFVLAWLARRPSFREHVGPRALLERAWRWSAVAAVVGLLVFVAVDPFLWPDPVGKTREMLQFRQQEMFGQRTLNEELATPEGTMTRLGFLLRRSTLDEPWAGRRLGVPLEGVLAVGGLVVTGWSIVRDRHRGALVGPGAVVGLWLLVLILGTAPNLGIDWDRYYLPIVTVGLAFTGVGAAGLADGVGRLVLARRRAPTASAATPPPLPTASSGSAG